MGRVFARRDESSWGRQVMGFVGTLAVVVVVGIVLLTLAVWRWQERVVFQPPGGTWPRLEGVRRVEYVAGDGVRLFAYVVGEGVATPARGALLAFHGNAEVAALSVHWAQEVAARTGRLVVLPEYRGYAGLGGTPTYDGSRLDARAAYAMVRDSLDVAPASIALFGHSLGSAIATELASEPPGGVPPQALLLQSPFTSARDMARAIVFRPVLLAWPHIARVHYDTEARVRTLRARVWVTHGERDFIIPVAMGKRVYAAAAEKGELLLVPRAGHNDVPEEGGAAYWQWVGRALRD